MAGFAIGSPKIFPWGDYEIGMGDKRPNWIFGSSPPQIKLSIFIEIYLIGIKRNPIQFPNKPLLLTAKSDERLYY